MDNYVSSYISIYGYKDDNGKGGVRELHSYNAADRDGGEEGIFLQHKKRAMTFKELDTYTVCGSFTFTRIEAFKEKCNAPKDKAGIYLIYNVDDSGESLIYIGSSGQRSKDGTLKIRKGGLYDRLVNGYHPNRFNEDKRIKRQYAFPKQMHREGIKKIKVYWWVTHGNGILDFPSDVEKIILSKYQHTFQKLPKWHK